LTDLDLHRPYVDNITFPNPNGRGGTMRRVPEVIDVWFDSGAMPVAQWGYPAHNGEMFEEQFPADYICEAVDQTRGWFYTLHAISSMVFEQVSFKNVICLGHILDAKGEKMSKSKGNVIDPYEVFNAHGADAFRWYLFTSGPPGEPRRFSVDLVGEVISRFWLTLWNTYSFFINYANLDGWTPNSPQPPVAERDLLDQFVLSELHLLVKNVTEAFDRYDVPGATRPVEQFVDMLSNWYVRLSRRRFWKSGSDADKQGAYATLYECLVTVSKLIAPTMPFLADALYRNLVVEVDPKAPMSVHLALFPESNPALINETLIREMRLVEKLVSLGRAARESVRMGVRQPLADARFAVREARESGVIDRFADLIKSELNVKAVGSLNNASDVVNYKLNPLQSLLGKKLRADFPKVQKWMRDDAPQSDKRRWAEALLTGANAVVELDGQRYELLPEEVQVTREAAEGYAVADDGGYLAALDTRLTPDLVDEGLAREVVRRVQSLRKDADFKIEDRIVVKYQAGDRLKQAITRFAAYISAETLADALEEGEVNGDQGYTHAVYQPDPNGDPKKDTSINGETLALSVKRT
ncbi:MAG: class I tRNA ligase family protein, partial [Anaerolinea sp.]|nr:class I tRNA ligase family protein [Anaerolinea sp.]